MNILFLTKTIELGASSRFRVYQYLPYLKNTDINFAVLPATSYKRYAAFEKQPTLINRITWFGSTFLRRIMAILQVKYYDCIFIQKETLPYFFPAAELLLKRFSKRVIFDFDDAIFYYRKRPNFFMQQFMDKYNIERILRCVDRVIVSNNYLANYARKYNNDVHVIPTSIEMSNYTSLVKNGKKQKRIGWIGSKTTVEYLKLLYEVFDNMTKKNAFELQIIGGGNITINNVNVLCKDWDLENEVYDIKEFDIGVMPLTDDPWARGKAGLKLIQYMAAGVPAVASRVGANCEIINDGINGFLATHHKEWEEKLTLLLTDSKLREKFALAGKKTVNEKYSVSNNFPKWYNSLVKW